MAHNKKIKAEIKALLEKLIPTKTHEGSSTIINGPSLEIQQQVPQRLLEIANESTESRTTVIKALIKVVDKPRAKKRFMISHQWLTAIDVLGRLKATEAIDVLTKNINETDPGLTMVYVFHGPAVVALAQIGEPAVPRLVKALSRKKAAVRRESAYTLGLIGGSDAERALEKALKKEKNKDVIHFIKAALPTEGPRSLPTTLLNPESYKFSR